MEWLNNEENNDTIINIHAGFDETSQLLKYKFPDSTLTVFDFYNQKKHTEISIKRARKAYPAFAGTQQISTSSIPLPDNTADIILITLAAHEIRNHEERVNFFGELKRVLKFNGKIFVTEHLRDLPNFLAFNIGFFHFLQPSDWCKTFNSTGLKVESITKTTPFITTFTLRK